MGKFLSKDDIVNADDRRFQEVEVPEWGGKVRVKTLTGTERNAFEADSIIYRGGNKEVNLENLQARFLVLAMVDDEGKRLFTSKDDVKVLGKKSAAALDRVFESASKLNGMTKADVEELTQGFTDAQSEDSISG